MSDFKRQYRAMIYVLAYPEIPPAADQRIDRFRGAHEPDRATLVRPHITLVFGVNGQHREDVLRLCKDVSSTTPSFAITFAAHEVAYDPFDKTHKLFLVCGLGKDTLTGLHEQLYSGPHRADFNSDIPYRPHTTVATNKDRAVVEGLEIDDLGPLPIPGRINALEVVELREGKLLALETLPLRQIPAH